MTQDFTGQEVRTGSSAEMNYKKGSRNGDYFARGAQESQAWAAEHITGGGDASSPRMHEEGKQQREKTQHLNHGTMLA